MSEMREGTPEWALAYIEDAARHTLLDEGSGTMELRRAVKIIQAALSQARADALAQGRREGLEWQPIETAPKDRNSVIVAVPSLHYGHPMIVGEAYYDPENGGWWWAGTTHGDYYSSPIAETNAPPTLWQPMPAPPDRATAQAETQKPEETA